MTNHGATPLHDEHDGARRSWLSGFERSLNDYLAETAKDWESETPELAADIRALRLASLKRRARQSILVDCDGPDEDVYWSCEYADGKFTGLDYDS